MFRRRLVTSFLFLGALFACFVDSRAYAETVIVNGKRYTRQGDAMYPQIDASWTDMKGVRHENWLTDYSSLKIPEQHPNFKEQHPEFKEQHPNFKEQHPKFKEQTPISRVRSIDPNVRIEDSGCKHKVSIGADALFEFDKFDLTPQAEKLLEKVMPTLVAYGQHPISIEGHTDSIGTDEYNQILSEKRAGTVKDWLLAHNYVAPQIDTVGFGKTHPIAPNTYNDGSDFPQGRAKNRRVEIIVDTCK